jgi:hypothetical protein
LYLFADTRERKKEGIEVSAEGDVEFCCCAEEAATFELVEEFAGPAEEEPYEDDIADSVGSVLEGMRLRYEGNARG